VGHVDAFNRLHCLSTNGVSQMKKSLSKRLAIVQAADVMLYGKPEREIIEIRPIGIAKAAPIQKAA